MGGIDGFTKLMLHCNGIDASTYFDDASAGTHPITAIATAQVDTAQKKFGTGSLLCDGDSDYIYSVDSADWDIANANFTIDFWVRFNSVAASAGFAGQYASGTDFWTIAWYQPGTDLRLYVYNSGVGDTYLHCSWNPSVNTWYHIAVVRSGNSGYIFIDGVDQSASLDGWLSFSSFQADLDIGYQEDGSWYLNGWMDEFRISKGVARWTANFTPPTKEYSVPDVTIEASVIDIEILIQAPIISVGVKIAPSAILASAEIQEPTIVAVQKVEGFDYRIVIKDIDGNVRAFVEKEAMDISWQYNRIGGCGAFNFTLPRRFDDQGDLGGDYEILIYRRSSVGAHTLWYSGFLEDRMPSLTEPEKIAVKGYGYSAQLSRIIVDATYSSKEISVIVKDILDNYVVPNTDITYDAADIEATTFTADTLTFNTTAQNALKTLAEIAGTREWGVDENKKFFFKARSSTVNFYYFAGHKVTSFSNIDSFREIINRIYIEGGEVGGTKYERTINDTDSQAKYGLREQIYQNAAITTGSVADQFGGAILAEKGDLARRGKLTVVDDLIQNESTIPLGTLIFRTTGVRYGEKKYGTFLYSGEVKYQINKINYHIEDNKTLVKTLDLGQLRPSISEEIEQLAFELEQLRAARE